MSHPVQCGGIGSAGTQSASCAFDRFPPGVVFFPECVAKPAMIPTPHEKHGQGAHPPPISTFRDDDPTKYWWYVLDFSKNVYHQFARLASGMAPNANLDASADGCREFLLFLRKINRDSYDLLPVAWIMRVVPNAWSQIGTLAPSCFLSKRGGIKWHRKKTPTFRTTLLRHDSVAAGQWIFSDGQDAQQGGAKKGCEPQMATGWSPKT